MVRLVGETREHPVHWLKMCRLTDPDLEVIKAVDLIAKHDIQCFLVKRFVEWSINTDDEVNVTGTWWRVGAHVGGARAAGAGCSGAHHKVRPRRRTPAVGCRAPPSRTRGQDQEAVTLKNHKHHGTVFQRGTTVHDMILAGLSYIHDMIVDDRLVQ